MRAEASAYRFPNSPPSQPGEVNRVRVINLVIDHPLDDPPGFGAGKFEHEAMQVSLEFHHEHGRGASRRFQRRRHASTCRAIISSSCVDRRSSKIELAVVEIVVRLETLACSSRCAPSHSSRRAIIRRTVAECSPIPPVKMKRSMPPPESLLGPRPAVQPGKRRDRGLRWRRFPPMLPAQQHHP